MGNGKSGAPAKWNWQRAHKADHNGSLGAREVDTVSWMIGNVQKNPMVTHDESTELFKELHGDEAFKDRTEFQMKRAKDRLITANLKLVIAVAKGYRRSGLDFEDLLQEGNLGLIKAVEKFKWQKGFRFSTYATWWIRQAVSQFVMKRSRTVRLPAHAIGVSRKLENIRADFKKKFGCDPTDEELSAVMDVSQSIIKATVNGSKRTVSLSTPLDRDSEGGDTLADTIADTNPANNPHEAYAEKESFEVLKRSFAKMTPKEEQILRLRFGICNDDANSEFKITEGEADEIASRGETTA